MLSPRFRGYKCQRAGCASARPRDGVCRRLRLKHDNLRNGKAYVAWIRRSILFHGKRHPRTPGATHAERPLSCLAVHGVVAASTLNQALSALLFLYREVLSIDLPWLDNVARAIMPIGRSGRGRNSRLRFRAGAGSNRHDDRHAVRGRCPD